MIHPDGALIGHAAVAQRPDFPNWAKILSITAVEGALSNLRGGDSLGCGRLNRHYLCASGNGLRQGDLRNHSCFSVGSGLRLGSTRGEQERCTHELDSHELLGWSEQLAARGDIRLKHTAAAGSAYDHRLPSGVTKQRSAVRGCRADPLSGGSLQFPTPPSIATPMVVGESRLYHSAPQPLNAENTGAIPSPATDREAGEFSAICSGASSADTSFVPARGSGVGIIGRSKRRYAAATSYFGMLFSFAFSARLGCHGSSGNFHRGVNICVAHTKAVSRGLRTGGSQRERSAASVRVHIPAAVGRRTAADHGLPGWRWCPTRKTVALESIQGPHPCSRLPGR